jgi:large subunit ribosomal protein L13
VGRRRLEERAAKGGLRRPAALAPDRRARTGALGARDPPTRPHARGSRAYSGPRARARQVVGKLATNIATLLIGKHKPTYVPRFDCGDHVVVINAKEVVFTGRKWDQKMYRHHTGWPGGLKETLAKDMLRTFPERVIGRAVRSMLPKNLLRKQRLMRLHVFPGPEHAHDAQVIGSYRMFGPRWSFGPKPERWYPTTEPPRPSAP